MTQKTLPPGDFRKQYSREMQEALVQVGFWKSCVNCEHFSNNSADRRGLPESRTCHRWNGEPPPLVIVLACDEWLHLIPF